MLSEMAYWLMIAGAVLVVLGVIGFARLMLIRSGVMSPTKTARASGCAGRARIGGRLSAGPELEPPRMRAVRLHPRQRRLASIG